MKKLSILFVVFAMPTGLLLLDDPLKPRSDLDKYQGSWILVSEEFEGKRVSPFMRDITCTFRGNKVVFESTGDGRASTIRLDPSKSPKTYDLVRDDNHLSLKGIYDLDGDKIRICISYHGNGDRPTEFKTAPGSDNQLLVWSRKN